MDDWNERRAIGGVVCHPRAVLKGLEGVRVMPALEGSALHLVDEDARALHRRNSRREPLTHAEMSGLPCHLVVEIHHAGSNACDGALACVAGRGHVNVNAAREVEAHLYGRADEGLKA